MGNEIMVSIASEINRIPTLEKTEPIDFPNFTELVIYCPYCKNLQILLLSQGELVGQRKYRQHNGFFYHDCGSDRPCDLYGQY